MQARIFCEKRSKHPGSYERLVITMLKLIPQPKQTKITEGFLSIPNKPDIILYSPKQDDRLVSALLKIWPDVIIRCEASEFYNIKIGDTSTGSPPEHLEGYFLNIQTAGLGLASLSAAGLFYGIQTLKQLVRNGDILCGTVTDWPDRDIRAMYLDLKQTFPKFDLLLSYIDNLAEVKTNALVIEYEDKLPFRRHHELRHPKFALSDEQFAQLKETAQNNFIEIIPLQQCFGHLEYLLKHTKYRDLRETENAIGELCPCKSESGKLVHELLKDVMDLHPDSRYVHIGCDEVWSLCSCPTCKKRYEGKKGSAFIEFVNPLIELVCARGKTPVLWHDMLAGCTDEELKSLDKRALVLIWIYHTRTVNQDAAASAKRFRALDINVAGGSAVRCNDRMETQDYPKVSDRVRNIKEWEVAADSLGIGFMLATNWATSFAMGSPYGIFETSFYTMYLASESHWNTNADTETFLQRFLSVFHGIDIDSEKLLNTRTEDYYVLMPSLSAQAVLHCDIADHLKIVVEGMHRAAESSDFLLYRHDMYHDSEGDMVSLRSRANMCLDAYNEGKEKLYASLLRFLPPEMTDIYMGARCFYHDFLIQNFYSRLI